MCTATDEEKNVDRSSLVNDPEMIYGELERQNAPEYDFFVPLAARWKRLDGDPEFYTDDEGKQQPYNYIKDLHRKIGDHLNKALAALQEANLDKLDGVFNQDNINFNKHSVRTTNKSAMKIYGNWLRNSTASVCVTTIWISWPDGCSVWIPD